MAASIRKPRMEQERCYYCGKFLSWGTWAKNWRVIQAPGVMDPEPYEISWCDSCEQDGRDR